MAFPTYFTVIPESLSEGHFDMKRAEFGTFSDARQHLINELLGRVDAAGDLCEEECEPGCACEFDNAAQDVNLWSTPQSISVGGLTYRIVGA